MRKHVGFSRLVFMVFSLTAVTLDAEIVILGIQTIIWQSWCLHWTILGAISSAWGRPGETWEQQERHVGFQRSIFNDFGVILGAHFESFLGSYLSNSVFLWGLFPSTSLCASILSGILDGWSSENNVFVMKVLQKQCFR